MPSRAAVEAPCCSLASRLDSGLGWDGSRRLAELELELPKPFAPPPGVEFPFDLVHTSGGLAYVSGHLPVDGSEVLMTGRVGGELELEQGYEAARLTGLSIFASLSRSSATSTG